MGRWVGLLVYSCLSCSLVPLGSPAQLVRLEDSCGREDGFDERMAELASSIWMSNDARGPVRYTTVEIGEAAAECPLDRYLSVQIFPDGGGYVGTITAQAVDRCTESTCEIVYMVGGR